jgi:hypothetical protein
MKITEEMIERGALAVANLDADDNWPKMQKATPAYLKFARVCLEAALKQPEGPKLL